MRSIVMSASVCECVCVCLSVCPRAYRPNHTRYLYQIFVHVAYRRGSVLASRRIISCYRCILSQLRLSVFPSVTIVSLGKPDQRVIRRFPSRDSSEIMSTALYRFTFPRQCRQRRAAGLPI